MVVKAMDQEVFGELPNYVKSETRIMNLVEELSSKDKRIASLEKENASLKAENKELKEKDD